MGTRTETRTEARTETNMGTNKDINKDANKQKKVRFIADSSCDMKEADYENLVTVPLTISTEKESWVDEKLDINQMLNVLEAYKGRSYTACPGPESWIKAFEGADTVYVATLTSGLSGTYNSAMAAKELFCKEHPEVRIHVFDTLTTAAELRLFMEKLMELDSQGNSFEEVCKKAQDYLKKTRLLFSLKSLHNFAQNGRVSKALASAVGVLGISIIGIASEEGTLQPIEKSRGDKRVVAKLTEQLRKLSYNGGKLRISHVQNEALAEQIKDAVKKLYPKADVLVYGARGLCSYYAERGAVLLGCETEQPSHS